MALLLSFAVREYIHRTSPRWQEGTKLYYRTLKLLDNLIHEQVEISLFFGSADCGFILKKNFQKNGMGTLKVKRSNMKTKMFDEL
ncbi:MAG: hypothetical protein ACFFD2_13830 [Promethearchaeota archaeon]